MGTKLRLVAAQRRADKASRGPLGSFHVVVATLPLVCPARRGIRRVGTEVSLQLVVHTALAFEGLVVCHIEESRPVVGYNALERTCVLGQKMQRNNIQKGKVKGYNSPKKYGAEKERKSDQSFIRDVLRHRRCLVEHQWALNGNGTFILPPIGLL